MDKDKVEQKTQLMDRLKSATYARYATEREIVSAGEFTPDEAIRLAVSLEVYKAEASLHLGDINRTSISEESRGRSEIVLAQAQQGNFQPLKELISSEALQQRDSLRGPNNELNEEQEKRFNQFCKLANALPQTGQPTKLPGPAWLDKRFKDIHKIGNDPK